MLKARRPFRGEVWGIISRVPFERLLNTDQGSTNRRSQPRDRVFQQSRVHEIIRGISPSSPTYRRGVQNVSFRLQIANRSGHARAWVSNLCTSIGAELYTESTLQLRWRVGRSNSIGRSGSGQLRSPLRYHVWRRHLWFRNSIRDIPRRGREGALQLHGRSGRRKSPG